MLATQKSKLVRRLLQLTQPQKTLFKALCAKTSIYIQILHKNNKVLRVELKQINWTMCIFFFGYHLAFLILLPLYLLNKTPSKGLIISTTLLFILSGLGITAGYHRFYSHKTYTANKIIESILLFFGTLAVQGSVIDWSNNHRLHHRFVDTDKDPYSIKKGFWHAHFLWILKKRQKYDPQIVHDLITNKLVIFQHKYYIPIMLSVYSLLIITFGLLFKDFFGAFTLLFLAHLFFIHHTTFFINSLAHSLGTKPYSKENSSVNNALLAFLTFGEGYHNFHHAFTSDYRNGVLWYQYDPAKYLIWSLSKLGLAKDLKKTNQFIIQKKLLSEDKNQLLEKLNKINPPQQISLRKTITNQYNQLNIYLSNLQYQIQEYKAQKSKDLKSKIQNLRKSINISFSSWYKLTNKVLKSRPAAI